MHTEVGVMSVETLRQLCCENLRGITSITELSRSNAKVNNLWVCDNIGIKLSPIKLVNPQ